MDYTIWLQILMELALAVSGEQDINNLLKKACRTFHRKLDCTHILVLQTHDLHFEDVFTSPKWAKSDEHFKIITKNLLGKISDTDLHYVVEELDNHFYYAFTLSGYGVLILAKGCPMSLQLIYELEPILDMFSTNIQGCLSFKRQLEIEKELREQKDYIEYYAYHDPVTDLPNRRKYIEVLKRALENKEAGAVILIDLDNFKRINDTLGHSFGDQVLKYISNIFKNLITENILIARFGGDEFQILVRNQSKEEIELFVHHIFDLFSRAHMINGRHVDISFSGGITLFPQNSSDLTQLLMNTDLAMYRIKNNSKNGYYFFDQTLCETFFYRNNIESIINAAVRDHAFYLVYQPQVAANTGTVSCYEALLRLENSTISPGEFIPIAEETKKIIAIGRIATHKAIKQLRKWLNHGYTIKPISINFSAAQIHDAGYFTFIKKQFIQFNIDPSLVEIEITENVLIDNKEKTLTLLKQLKALGLTLSIDDFGTGYSSLNYLTFLPLDKIKLDKSLIDKFLSNEESTVIDSLISLSHSLNLKVVAEGVEHAFQYHHLNRINCDAIQGFYFSRPLDVNAVPETFNKCYLTDITSDSIIEKYN